MSALAAMPARLTSAVMRSRRAWPVTKPVEMIAPPVTTAGGKPVIPLVAPGARPILPFLIVVPATPLLVMAVPPRIVKFSAVSRTDRANPGAGAHNSAASATRGNGNRFLIVMQQVYATCAPADMGCYPMDCSLRPVLYIIQSSLVSIVYAPPVLATSVMSLSEQTPGAF